MVSIFLYIAKGAFGEAEAEAKFEAWKNNKQSGMAALKAKQEEAKKAEAKARLEAEKKVWAGNTIESSLIWQMLWITAVSYTHLDVYKRQVHIHFRFF